VWLTHHGSAVCEMVIFLSSGASIVGSLEANSDLDRFDRPPRSAYPVGAV
jgi:hypothetical protein